MSDATRGLAHSIYAKRYFDASPTWFAWNKLTARDVHALREERGYESQNFFFCLNHPIRFISLTGLAVQIELAGGAGASRYCLISLDDGSGKIVTVKITRRLQDEADNAEYLSNTIVDNLDVHVSMGLPTLFIDKREVTLGTPIRVRGSLSTFREVRQLELKRIKVLTSTNEEAKSWLETARWKKDVLCKPWILTDAERERIDADLLAQEHQDAERRQKKREWYARQSQKLKKAAEKDDAKREVLESYYNKGALPGSEKVTAPWE